MDLQIALNGRMRTVSVEPSDGRHRVTVDGKTWIVDAASVDASSLSLIFPELGHASEDVGLAPGATNGDLTVHLSGGTLALRVLSGAARYGRGAGPAAQAEGLQQVVAPMPGKVVKVLVKAGDAVKARQGLIVVEAMKMENELRSPKDGRVVEVPVSEGTSVEAGRLLVVVE